MLWTSLLPYSFAVASLFSRSGSLLKWLSDLDRLTFFHTIPLPRLRGFAPTAHVLLLPVPVPLPCPTLPCTQLP